MYLSCYRHICWTHYVNVQIAVSLIISMVASVLELTCDYIQGLCPTSLDGTYCGLDTNLSFNNLRTGQRLPVPYRSAAQMPNDWWIACAAGADKVLSALCSMPRSSFLHHDTETIAMSTDLSRGLFSHSSTCVSLLLGSVSELKSSI